MLEENIQFFMSEDLAVKAISHLLQIKKLNQCSLLKKQIICVYILVLCMFTFHSIGHLFIFHTLDRRVYKDMHTQMHVRMKKKRCSFWHTLQKRGRRDESWCTGKRSRTCSVEWYQEYGQRDGQTMIIETQREEDILERIEIRTKLSPSVKMDW